MSRSLASPVPHCAASLVVRKDDWLWLEDGGLLAPETVAVEATPPDPVAISATDYIPISSGFAHLILSGFSLSKMGNWF